MALGRAAGGAVGVAALAVWIQLLFFDRSLVPIDEGQLATIADRLLGGEVLYRDVHTGLFPGIYYVTAGLFALFGADVAVTRWAQLAVNAATALLLWLLGRRAVGEGWSLLAPVLYVALVPLGFPGLTMFNYSPLSLLCALAMLLFLLRYLEAGRGADALVAGACLAASGLVKQNFGALALATLLTGFFWGRRGGPLGSRPALPALAPVLGTAAAASAAALAGLAVAGALPSFVDATLLSLFDAQLDAFADPLPPIFGRHPVDDGRFAFVYTPAILHHYMLRPGETLFGLTVTGALGSAAVRLAYGGAIATLAAAALLLWLPRSRATPAQQRAGRLIGLFALFFFLGIFPSAIWSHLAFVLAPLLLVGSLAAERGARLLASRSRLAGRVWTGAVALLAVLALAAALRFATDLRRWFDTPLALDRATLFVDRKQRAALAGAVDFLRKCAPPSAPVFAAPDLPIAYFLAERRNPTPYDLVIPGNVDGALIVERLVASGTRCVLYNPQRYRQFAAFPELFPRVAEYLAAEFETARVIGSGALQWRGLVRR